MEINTKCCETEMINVGVVDLLNGNINEVKRFVCGVCGRHIDIINYSLDDDEFLMEIDNYDELKNTKIHKELENEFLVCDKCKKKIGNPNTTELKSKLCDSCYMEMPTK